MINPLKYIGRPMKHGHAAWYKRNYTKRNIRIAKAISLDTGRDTHILPMGEHVLIVNNLWRKQWNKQMPRGAAITGLMLVNQALYTAKNGKIVKPAQ